MLYSGQIRLGKPSIDARRLLSAVRSDRRLSSVWPWPFPQGCWSPLTPYPRWGCGRRSPTRSSSAIYECGFETLSGKWNRFNFRFYTIALLFVIFDVEVVFLFPWAASFGVLSSQFGAFILVEMLVFVAILLVGWLYAWRKGALEWS